MGGLFQGLSTLRGVVVTSALIKNSLSPWNFLILHRMAFLSGSYLALPAPAEQILHEAVFGGTGIVATTVLAKLVLSKMALIFTLNSTLFQSGNSQTTGTILNGRLMFSEIRYVMTSNIPSGGINVIDLSRSNLPSLTHQWNFISSICIPRSLFVAFLMRSLSFIPNLHSGMPLRAVLTRTWPQTSALKTVPLFDRSTFTLSTMSMKTSFFLYFIPSALQDIAPVAYIVIYFNFSMF